MIESRRWGVSGHVDGRVARGERTRRAIVDAHTELVSEGVLKPTAQSVADRAGVSIRALWSNFNDLESVEAVFKAHEIACLITEPVLQNIGVVLPRPGYLEGLRRLCDQYGVVLIFDEVKTGFRSALGGYQSVAGV